MINLLWMQTAAASSIGGVLQNWENLGIFSYVLPFILIFAVVYAILDKVEVFEGKNSLNMVIALAVGLLSLQFEFVPLFFSEIFPRAGIAISVLLVALILAGAFIDWNKSKGFYWIFFGLAAIAFLLVIANSFAAFSFFGSGWWDNYGSAIIVLVILIALVTAVMLGGSDSEEVKKVKAAEKAAKAKGK